MRVRLRLDNLKELVARSNISQNHLAIRIGISKGHWSEVLNGRHLHPSPRTRERLLEVFGVEFDDLFEVIAEPDTDELSFRSAVSKRYPIDRQLGQGGMGTVYLARDVKHGRLVALKVISAEAVSGIGSRQFLKEIRYTARLQHHHILPLFDSGEAAGQPYYVMPFIRAGSLRDRLTKTVQMPLDECISIISGVASALDHAHLRRVVHCDIKPENILLSEDHALVADFGVARAIREEMREWGKVDEIDSSAGTPAYVSPEQASGEDLQGSTDIYSLGCVVYEMLAGRPPFYGNNTLQVVSRRFTEPAPDLRSIAPHLPDGVAWHLTRAMAFDIRERPTTATQLVEELRHAAGTGKSFSLALRGVSRSAERLRRSLMPHWRRGIFMSDLIQDFRQALRSLVRQPFFALLAMITLALGIGANASIFSVMNAVLLRPLPYHEPDRLLRLGDQYNNNGSMSSMSPGNFLQLQREATLLSGMAASASQPLNLTGLGEAERVSAAFVTPGYFELFGVRPRVGRTIEQSDDSPGAHVVVLSHRFGRDRFEDGAPVLGTTIELDGVDHEVIGVLDASVEMPGDPDLFLPMGWTEDQKASFGNRHLSVWGRLAPGATLESAHTQLIASFDRLRQDHPDANENWSVNARFLQEFNTRNLQTPLLILMGAVGLVLLIACANVANLMLARLEGRQREVALRSALGADRWRILRLFITEGLWLSIGAGVVGFLLSVAFTRFLLSIAAGVRLPDSIPVDGFVIAFAVGLALITGVGIGALPAAVAFRQRLSEVLKEGGRGSSGGQGRLRRGLVGAQVALSVMLVSGAGLLIRSFANVYGVDMGVDRNVLTASVSLPESTYPDAEGIDRFIREAVEGLSGAPGVTHAGATNRLSFGTGNYNITTLRIDGMPDVEANFVEIRWVTPGFFEAIGLSLYSGRDLDYILDSDSTSRVVINRTLARELFGEGDPLGARLNPGFGGRLYEIVGVVNDMREFGPDRDPRPAIYLLQNHDGFAARQMVLVVQTPGEPGAAAPLIRSVVYDLDPNVPVYSINTMPQLIARTTAERKFAMTMLAMFAAIALLLGSIGIYGVMSYSVAQRTREMGVRMALGAKVNQVAAIVIGDATRFVMVGTVVGLGAALLLSRLMDSMLFGVASWDPVTLAGVTVVLTGVALAACAVPAVRASRIDPAVALRHERG